MNDKIKSSPLRPERAIEAHHWRHLISGSLVFCAGVFVTETLALYREHRPLRVRWMDGDRAIYEYHAVSGRCELPTNNFRIQLGVADNGILVWKLLP
jgi:hypothetical protein